jgi:hypothetical protein
LPGSITTYTTEENYMTKSITTSTSTDLLNLGNDLVSKPLTVQNARAALCVYFHATLDSCTNYGRAEDKEVLFGLTCELADRVAEFIEVLPFEKISSWLYDVFLQTLNEGAEKMTYNAAHALHRTFTARVFDGLEAFATSMDVVEDSFEVH